MPCKPVYVKEIIQVAGYLQLARVLGARNQQLANLSSHTAHFLTFNSTLNMSIIRIRIQMIALTE